MHLEQSSYEPNHLQQLGSTDPPPPKTDVPKPPNSRETSPSPRTGQETAMRRTRPSSICPQCGTHVTKNPTFCLQCGIELSVCQGCKSINLALADFCHMCGESMIVSSYPNEIAKIITWEDRDLGALDQAVLAIIKLRGGVISLSETSAALGISPDELGESINRLEQAQQIENA